MNIEKLREELKIDEGVKYEIYLDHLGLKTCGIGHLIQEGDEEYGKPVGTEVYKERVNELFAKDVQVTINECSLLYGGFTDLPEEVKYILANMMFNMGRPRLSRFHKMRRAIEAGDWKEAAVQMKDSKWYRQVPNRAERLVKRMEAVT